MDYEHQQRAYKSTKLKRFREETPEQWAGVTVYDDVEFGYLKGVTRDKDHEKYSVESSGEKRWVEATFETLQENCLLH